MKQLLRRIIERIKNEPAMIGTAVVAALNIAAAFGLELTSEQRDALLWGLPIIIGTGLGVRSQVRPTRKDRDGPRPAQLHPDLTSRRRR